MHGVKQSSVQRHPAFTLHGKLVKHKGYKYHTMYPLCCSRKHPKQRDTLEVPLFSTVFAAMDARSKAYLCLSLLLLLSASPTSAGSFFLPSPAVSLSFSVSYCVQTHFTAVDA
jgi:hypothetical protein